MTCPLHVYESTGRTEMREDAAGQRHLEAELRCVACGAQGWSRNPREVHAALRERRAAVRT